MQPREKINIKNEDVHLQIQIDLPVEETLSMLAQMILTKTSLMDNNNRLLISTQAEAAACS